MNIPAFPTAQYANGIYPTGYSPGMSLLDYFAIQLVAVLVQNDETEVEADVDHAYMIAGMMLKAREKAIKTYSGDHR